MSLIETINADLKKALLEGKKDDATILRGIKSALQNEVINRQKQETGLNDQEIVTVLKKEAKKRQESADLYIKHGEKERQDRELYEKQIISRYLPEEMSEAELKAKIDEIIQRESIELTNQNLGQIIGKIKVKLGDQADGGAIAAVLKRRINQ